MDEDKIEVPEWYPEEETGVPGGFPPGEVRERLPDWAVTEMMKEFKGDFGAEPKEEFEEVRGEIPPIPEDFIAEMARKSIEESPREIGEEEALLDWAKAEALKYPEIRIPETYEQALQFKRDLPVIQRDLRLSELAVGTKEAGLEAQKVQWEDYIKKLRPGKWQRFLKGSGKFGKWGQKSFKPRPRMDLAKIFFPGDALRKTYLPGSKVRALTTPPTATSPIGELQRPHLEGLMRVSAPPPSAPIKIPFRDVERKEGLGSAFARLRGLGKFPDVDWAVYSEVHANGDIDTPSHIRKEVKQLGFSRKEIDDSLKRLRNVGLIAPTGHTLNGEKELMVTGEADGNRK